MGLLGQAKRLLNAGLRPANARLESLTAETAERTRLDALARAGHFDRPIAPLPESFRRCDPTALLAAVRRAESRFEEFARAPAGGEGFSLDNPYYTTPDAEILHAMVQVHRPQRIVEVGSGNSTLLFRAAIQDAGLSTRLVSIDPQPRREVLKFTDQAVRRRVEALPDFSLFTELGTNDILFIDSSHEIAAGNDVIYLFLQVLPRLAPGVLIHIHDIFLPYEYPRAWLLEHRWPWTEQYLVQAMVESSPRYEVLWAGHYFQRTIPDFTSHFKFWRSWDARSLWLRKQAPSRSATAVP